jgi:hypothetical protein
MHVYRSTNSKPIHIFQFQKSIIIYLGFFYRCFFLLATNLKSDCFYTMLIARKCMPLYKKLDCDTKSEPPYFATNLPTIFKCYLPSKDMLKRIACVLVNSLTFYSYLYLISLPLPRIKAWMLQKKNQKIQPKHKLAKIEAS